MEGNTVSVFVPFVQYGFAGFSFVLLGVIFWMIRKLIDVVSKNSEVITINTKTIESLMEHSNEGISLMRDIYERLLSRPCMME